MVVDTTVVLDRDLECQGTGLVLRNPRATVQLNGHTVRFTDGCDGATAAGIRIESTADGAQILGPGAIRGFPTGIGVDGAARVQLRDLTVSESCGRGIALVHADAFDARNLLLRKNGSIAGDGGSALDVDDATTLVLSDSAVFLNGAGARSAAIDLRGCVECRLSGNRIIGNRGIGLRLDTESHGCEVQRNVVLDHERTDIADHGADNAIALNAFERGDGVTPPALWPLIGPTATAPAGVAGCATLSQGLAPGETVTVTCPQDPGLRGLRNTVVGYRFLNPFNPALPFPTTCDPAEIVAATSGGGGAVRCRNSDRLWALILEVTCCLN